MIRGMTIDDIGFAAALVASEGWIGETPAVFEGFIENDCCGCFVAEDGGAPVGMCVSTRYGDSGFVGELIVNNNRRGEGIGKQLFDRALDHLESAGTKSVCLDADLDAVPFYERNGFRKICRSLRFVGVVEGRAHPAVRQAFAADMPAVIRLDKERFGADRSFFLERRLRLFSEFCLVFEAEGEIEGYIMAQPGLGVLSVGPCLARGATPCAAGLIGALSERVGEVRLRIGTLESNVDACRLIRSFSGLEEGAPCWRMVRGRGDGLGGHADLFAIGSAAKG